MKNYTRIKVHYVKPTEYAKERGIKDGEVIAEFIYKTDSHALATHQCRKDNPSYDDRIVLEAMPINIEDEKYKALYETLKANEQVMEVYGWN